MLKIEDTIIRLEPETVNDDYSDEIESKRQHALANTLTASNYYDTPFSEIFVGEWESMSEDDRSATIEQDYADIEEIYGREYRQKESAEMNLALYEALETCLDMTAEYAESLGFEVYGKDISSNADSGYISVISPDGNESFRIRFSDHEQPSGGSYFTNKRGDSGRYKADYSTILKQNSFDLSGVFGFLRTNAENKEIKDSPEMSM